MCKTMSDFNKKYFPKQTAKRGEYVKKARETKKCPLCNYPFLDMIETTLGDIMFVHDRTFVYADHYKIIACLV